VRAAVLDAPGRLAVREVDVMAQEGLVTVRVEQVGVCGTDRAVVDGRVPVATPRVIGHEVVGTVQDGAGLDGLSAGDRVLVDPSAWCGSCRTCRRGLVHLCPSGGLMGRDVDGGLAEYVAVPRARLHLVPAAVAADDAALLQVLGTCVHAQRAVPTSGGGAAVVVGVGVSGLLHVQLLRARGAGVVVAVGRSAAKRALAARFGATATCRPDEAAEVVATMTGGEGADTVIEAAGAGGTVRLAVDLAGFAATIVAFGTVSPVDHDVPLHDLYRKEARLLHPRAAVGADYDEAIALIAAGRISGAPIVTDRLPMSEAPATFATWRDHPERLKVVFAP
jgi:threonine dehydrogenase-like Zn-dependent dehydrogenase